MWQNEYMTKGNTSALFSPNDLLTRAMLVTILHNMEGRPYVPGTSKFTDVQNSNEWYYVAIKWAAKNNIVSGYSNGKLNPKGTATRVETASMIYKYCIKIK